MAKAKKTAKTASTKRAEISLPTGFKAIESTGKFWSGREPGDTLLGVLKSKSVKHFPKGKYPARDANIYIIKTKQGAEVEVTQSGGLNALESVKKGAQVYIQFLGMKKLKGRREPMREYVVATK